jgi:NADH-quinone oxidoreductase subunit J
MGLDAVVFYLLAAIAVVSAALVVLQRSPLYSALSLIVTLVSLAVIFVQLNAGFLGAIQVIVYAGAIMVLFVFIIMLLNLGDVGGRRPFSTTAKVAGAIALGLVFASLYPAFRGPETAGVPEEAGRGFGSVEAVGRSLFGEYVLPFELAGILLLAAIVGTIVLARHKP